MSLFVTGTDTDAGKTVACAALLHRYRAFEDLRYWKPVQTGPAPHDRETVLALTGLPADRILPNALSFPEPLSPHRAAELAGANIQPAQLLEQMHEYAAAGPLLVEGAGGLFVPLRRASEPVKAGTPAPCYTWVDFLKAARLPVILVARTTLGTINHSLLTIAALRANALPIAGLVFCGPPNADNVRTIAEASGLPVLAAFAWQPGQPLPEDVDSTGALAEYLT